MYKLSLAEIEIVSGEKDVGVLAKTIFVTAKKMSMIWCIGKEIKAGVQIMRPLLMVKAASCIALTTFAREYLLQSFSESEKQKQEV